MLNLSIKKFLITGNKLQGVQLLGLSRDVAFYNCEQPLNP